MKISGFSFVRNGTLYGYPFIESIQSILPLCDEFIIAVGKSEDDTLNKIRLIGDSRIRIIETVWDDSLRTGGQVLAQQTDIALRQTSGDWAFYLQADEVVHEKDLDIIRAAATQYLNDPRVEGLLFDYNHFYGRVGQRKLRVKPVNASIYHYGWVKPPRIQQRKQRTFNRLWHSDAWIEEHVKPVDEFDYAAGGRLELFAGTHPRVMEKKVREEDWHFAYDDRRVKQSFKDRILDSIERRTGYRLAEYRNYVLI
jgi:hypothetical protein